MSGKNEAQGNLLNQGLEFLNLLKIKVCQTFLSNKQPAPYPVQQVLNDKKVFMYLKGKIKMNGLS